MRRQQTLRASVDWSHALLSEPERILLRRVAAFVGGFDLDAAHAVGGDGDAERYQTLDQLLLLVDKSLVIAESSSSRTRYRMLETVRQYALEKLGESGEADAVRCRHRDHYTAMAVALDAPMQNDHEKGVKQVEVEIDNLRSAFEWSCESGDIEEALVLASSLQPLWLARGRIREGLGWLDVALAVDSAHGGEFRAARAKVVADKTSLLAWSASPATATPTRRKPSRPWRWVANSATREWSSGRSSRCARSVPTAPMSPAPTSQRLPNSLVRKAIRGG